MRNILTVLSEYRKVQLKAANATDERLREVDDKFNFMDRALNSLMLNGNGFDGPESKLAEVMTSADFTYAIQTFVERQMLPGYTEQTFAFEPLVKPETTPNFLPVSRYQNRGGLDDLEFVGEKGEARPGSVDDATSRQFQVYKFEKQFDFSMETLVNDDLGYFTDHAQNMGRAARRSLEKFVARFFTNAVTVARLIALGALYSTTGRLTTARISEARMAFGQRTNTDGEMIQADLVYLVYHNGLADTVAQIQASTLVPELATNAVNVVKGTFTPIKCPYIAGTAPNLPWFAFSDYKANGIIPFVLARRQGVPAPLILRKRSDIEAISSLLGGGAAVPPIWGDFATGNIVVKVHDEWGTYINGTDGNMFDHRGSYYSSGTAA